MSNKAPSGHNESYRIISAESIDTEALCTLYDSVGWSTYTNDVGRLRAAIDGSDFVVAALEGDDLVGLARAISDDVSVAYLQDILVRPKDQGRGIGTSLVKAVLERYEHVRQKVLLTDGQPEQLQFYASLGFMNTRHLEKTPLNAFVIIEDADLA